jgi:PAS domain S-box-containing protein
MFSVLVGWFSFSRRRAERLLADARDNLESRVAERTSELALANQELRRTQAYMAETQKLTHTGTCVWRVSSREYIYWSDEMFRIFGLEPQRTPLPYQSTLEMLHSDDLPQFEYIAEQAVACKSSGEMDFSVVRPDGSVRHMHAVFHPVLDQAGNVVELWRTGMDITERLQTEEAMRVSEERFRTLFQAVQVGVVVSGPKAEVLMCNPAALELLGLSEEELLGTTSYDPKWVTFYEDGSPCPPPEHPILRAIATGQPVRNLLLGVDLPSSGRRVWLLVNALPQTASDGSVSRVICTFLDLTDRKRTQEELEGSRDQLRALAARLEYVREEERTTLAREIHDELGSVLTAVKIDLSSLLHNLPPKKQQVGASIIEQLDGTLHTVRRICTDLRPSILDTLGPVAAIEWAAEEFEARTGIKCHLDLLPEDLSIEPEHGTVLFRIFQETLTNVARHANASELDVRLAKDDGNLLLGVHDNGKGIHEDQIAQGRSLGILGMRERALLVGGELTISGAPGMGTTVLLRIPQTQPPRTKGPHDKDSDIGTCR